MLPKTSSSLPAFPSRGAPPQPDNTPTPPQHHDTLLENNIAHTPVTEDSDSRKRRTKYNKIDDDLRSKMIANIEVKSMSIRQAAKALHINYSTAKTIYSVYKKEGRIKRKITKNVPASARSKAAKRAAATRKRIALAKKISSSSQNSHTRTGTQNPIPSPNLKINEPILDSLDTGKLKTTYINDTLVSTAQMRNNLLNLYRIAQLSYLRPQPLNLLLSSSLQPQPQLTTQLDPLRLQLLLADSLANNPVNSLLLLQQDGLFRTFDDSLYQIKSEEPLNISSRKVTEIIKVEEDNQCIHRGNHNASQNYSLEASLSAQAERLGLPHHTKYGQIL